MIIKYNTAYDLAKIILCTVIYFIYGYILVMLFKKKKNLCSSETIFRLKYFANIKLLVMHLYIQNIKYLAQKYAIWDTFHASAACCYCADSFSGT